MDTKSFLIGYFYAALQLHKDDEKNSIKTDHRLNQIRLYTLNGGKLTVGINRGICPITGSVAYAFIDTEKSSFDVVNGWTTPEIWRYIELNHDVCFGETRIRINDLVSIIDFFGGIDIEKMK